MNGDVIRRAKRSGSYSVLPNEPINDPRLSYKALGILTYLLSKPDDWEVMLSDLEDRGADGRESVQSGVKELVKFGYMQRIYKRDSSGRITGSDFIVYDLPNDGKTVIRLKNQNFP